jgi:hypothetical protein
VLIFILRDALLGHGGLGSIVQSPISKKLNLVFDLLGIV